MPADSGYSAPHGLRGPPFDIGTIAATGSDSGEAVSACICEADNFRVPLPAEASFFFNDCKFDGGLPGSLPLVSSSDPVDCVELARGRGADVYSNPGAEAPAGDEENVLLSSLSLTSCVSNTGAWAMRLSVFMRGRSDSDASPSGSRTGNVSMGGVGYRATPASSVGSRRAGFWC